jgi:hypothetical protein
MVTLDVSLLGRDYKVACKADEEAELRDAVAFLEARMREIRGKQQDELGRARGGDGGAQSRSRLFTRAGPWQRRGA